MIADALAVVKIKRENRCFSSSEKNSCRKLFGRLFSETMNESPSWVDRGLGQLMELHQHNLSAHI